MWFDGQRQPNTIYAASVSRGKDSTAMLRAIQLMGFPLDIIVSVDIWATKDIPAELPPMVKFKEEYDKKVFDMFGVPVTRTCAINRSKTVNVERERELSRQQLLYDKLSYEDYFYRVIGSGKHCGQIKGFPHLLGGWCHRLKTECVDIRGYILQTVNEQIFKRQKSWVSDEKGKLVYGGTKEGGDECPPYVSSQDEERRINIVYYVGIAADEPKRIAKHINKKDIILPLVQIGRDEALCGLEAQYMGLLSPTYTTSLRDGCWFCHNQGVEQLRNLRKDYPDLWRLLLKWDADSPVTFHADGRTVHDYDKRFSLEDEGKIQIGKGFRWKQVLDSNNENVKSDTAC